MELFDAFRSIWRNWGGNLKGGPWVLLGHTHVPLKAPSHPETGGIWRKYINSGCCIFDRMIRSIEWVFGDDMVEPEVRFVAWRWSSHLGPVLPGAEREISARRMATWANNRVIGPDGVTFTLNNPYPPPGI